MAKFVGKLQLAKHDMDDFVDLGEMDLRKFIAEFSAVDWEFEADRLQFLDRTWPSIGVINSENGAVLWTAAYRPLPPDFLDEDEFRSNMAIWFTVKLDNPPNPPEITDLKTGRMLANCHFETYEDGLIDELFEFFFEDDYDALYEQLYSMDIVADSD